MRFRVTCVVERENMIPLVELMAPYGAVIVKPEGVVPGKVETVGGIGPVVVLKKRRHAAIQPQRGLGSLLTLRTVAKGPPHTVNLRLKAAFKDAKLAPNGVGATLSKIGKVGYIRKGAQKGEWVMTPKGENALRRFDGVNGKAEAAHDETVQD